MKQTPSPHRHSSDKLLFLTDDEQQLEQLRNRDIERPTIIGNSEQVREIIDEYASAGVNELIVPDFTMGGMNQKIETMDKFIQEVVHGG